MRRAAPAPRIRTAPRVTRRCSADNGQERRLDHRTKAFTAWPKSQEMKEIKRAQGHHACSQCDAAFGRASHLRLHVRTVHEQRRDHACPQCDAAFGRASDLRQHVRTVHEQRRDHA